MVRCIIAAPVGDRGGQFRVMAGMRGGPTRRGLKVAVALAIALASGVSLPIGQSERPSAQQARQQGSPAPVPVSAARVSRQDVPHYLSGLGTVQAFNAVL